MTGITVLRVNAGLHGVNLGGGPVADGDPVAVIGQNNTATTTTVASEHQAVNTITGGDGTATWTEAFRLSDQSDYTAAGGPVVDVAGNLVGIAVSGVTTDRASDPDGRQYALSVKAVAGVVDDIARIGIAIHSEIGAAVSDSITGTVGARVIEVTPDSPADRAGLHANDVITSFDGVRVAGASQLIAQVRAANPTLTVPVTFTRGGTTNTVTVKPTALP